MVLGTWSTSVWTGTKMQPKSFAFGFVRKRVVTSGDRSCYVTNQKRNIKKKCYLTLARFFTLCKHWLQLLFELLWFPFIIAPIALIEKKNDLAVHRLAISHSEAVSTVLISCHIMLLTWYGFEIMLGYGTYLTAPSLVRFGEISSSFDRATLFWLDLFSPKYEPCVYQTRLICPQSVLKRYDKVWWYYLLLRYPSSNLTIKLMTAFFPTCFVVYLLTLWKFYLLGLFFQPLLQAAIQSGVLSL